MQHPSVKSRTTKITAAAALAVLGLGAAAQANLVLDLRLASGQASTVSANGSAVVNLDVWAKVTGGATAANLQDAFFGVSNDSSLGVPQNVSLVGAFSGVATDTTPNVTTSSTGSTYAGAGGAAQLGGTDSASANGWVFARATSMQPLTADANGLETKIATLQYSIANTGSSGTFNLAPVVRTAANSLVVPALWQENGVTFDGSTAGSYAAGSGVALSVAAGFIPGDVNHDHIVDLGDINFVTSHWLNTGVDQADANGDGTVDLGDINFITARWLNTGEPGGIAAALVAVPEPASIGLLGLGALGVLARRRK